MENSELIRWSETLAGIARTGLAFTTNQYERERFEEVLHVAGDMAAHLEGPPEKRVQDWIEMVTPGVGGYVAAKSAVGAFVGNDDGELLLIKRSDTHRWFIPTGWADVGFSLAELVMKEVSEETGLEVEPVSIVGVIDGLQAGSPHPHHTTLFHCRVTGGALNPHPLETEDVGWFAEDAMPEPLVKSSFWNKIAFPAIKGEIQSPYFDSPRDPIWDVPFPRQ